MFPPIRRLVQARDRLTHEVLMARAERDQLRGSVDTTQRLLQDSIRQNEQWRAEITRFIQGGDVTATVVPPVTTAAPPQPPPGPVDEIELAVRYFLKPGTVAIDVGANVGRYTSVMAEIASRVYAFEPQEDVFEQLSNAMRGTNVRCIKQAVTDHAGTVDFFIDTRPEMQGVASSVNLLQDLEAMKQVRKVTVQATTIDELVEREQFVPSFIKVDVEGHEPGVFRGARKTLEKHRPVLLFEFWENWWGRGFKELFEEPSSMYHLTRVRDGVDALAFYRRYSADRGADIIARPK
jgi:FkbM family methyltransferase